MEEQGDFTYFATSVSYEQKAAAEVLRKQQQESPTPALTEIELYNLDTEKQGVGIVFSKRLQPNKANFQQIKRENPPYNFRHCPNSHKCYSFICTTCWQE